MKLSLKQNQGLRLQLIRFYLTDSKEICQGKILNSVTIVYNTQQTFRTFVNANSWRVPQSCITHNKHSTPMIHLFFSKFYLTICLFSWNKGGCGGDS